MVNKKAYLKTLEAVMAIVIFLIFIVAALVFNQAPEDTSVPMDVKAIQESILSKIETEQNLRQCVITEDLLCLENEMISLIPSRTMEYAFEVCVSEPSNCLITLPEETTVYADSMIIQEEGQSAIFRLFMWKKI